MGALSSKMTSPNGPSADQETQTVAGLAPPSSSLPPASTNNGTPHPEPVALPPAATGATSSAPPALASSPSSRNIDDGSAAHQEPVRTTTSAPSAPSPPSVPSPPSAPALHPSLAASLQHATMMQAARVRPAGTAPTGTNSPRPAPTQRSPTVAPVPTSFHTDCANPTCIAASRRIHDVRFMQDTFARINANYSANYDIAEANRAALNTAYQVLLDCEYGTIMARVDSVTTIRRQANGQPTLNNRHTLIHLLRRTGMQISSTPRAAPGPAATGTEQGQSVPAGGGPLPAGAATPAAPVAPVHMPAVGHAPAVGYMPQAGGNTAGMNVA